MENKIRINELCYSTLSSDKPNTFDTYVSNGGYDAWKKIVTNSMDKKEIIDTVLKSGLLEVEGEQDSLPGESGVLLIKILMI